MDSSFKRVNYDSPYKDMSVLIADDFEAITRALSSACEQLGFKTIFQARDGQEATKYLQHNQVDIIISDWKMPKMDGLALLKHVRQSKTHANVPFVMLTGNLHQSDVVQAIEAGVSEYLVKPFSRVTLAERVHKAFVSPIKSHLAQRSDSAQVEAPPSKRTILVVDDEPSNLQVLGEVLKETYKIKVCRSGQQAIDICGKPDKPDLILLDIMMPEMDGLAVCQALKSNPQTEFIPIIFVSALSQTDDVVKGLKLGAVDYIQKPVIPEIVLARVETHVNSVIQREKLSQQIDNLIDSARHHDEALQTFFHDFRSPLTALHSTLMAQMSDSDETKLLRESSSKLVDMIDNYSVLLELERGDYKPNLSVVILNSTVQQVIASYQANAKQMQVEFQLDIDPAHQFQGDELLSYTMLSNLLTNAIEAAPPQSTISVTSCREEQQLVIKITNQGSVPETLRDRFFDKFVTAGKSSGKGLGCYSAKLCVEAQGGEIKLDVEEQATAITLILVASD